VTASSDVQALFLDGANDLSVRDLVDAGFLE
jgi:hypothetical protein